MGRGGSAGRGGEGGADKCVYAVCGWLEGSRWGLQTVEAPSNCPKYPCGFLEIGKTFLQCCLRCFGVRTTALRIEATPSFSFGAIASSSKEKAANRKN